MGRSCTMNAKQRAAATAVFKDDMSAILAAEAWPAEAFPLVFMMSINERTRGWFVSFHSKDPIELLDGQTMLILESSEDRPEPVYRRTRACCAKAFETGLRRLELCLDGSSTGSAHQRLAAEALAAKWDAE